MRFIPLSPAYAGSWFSALLHKLLVNDRDVLRLIRRNPLPDAPPVHVRAVLYRYRYTRWRERRGTGAWWRRALTDEFAAPVSLRQKSCVRR